MSDLVSDPLGLNQILRPEYVQVDKEILISAYDSTKLAIEYVRLAQLSLARSDEPDSIKYRTWEKQMNIDLEILRKRLSLLTTYR